MTEADFLHAILDRPDDDTPRLAFADWLDDPAGHLPEPDAARARAEFVRCHVRAVETRCVLDRPDDPDSPHRYLCGECPACAAWRRAEDLFATKAVAGWYPAGWDCYLREPPGGMRAYELPSLVLSRGFGESVVAPAADWYAHGGALLEVHPLRRVTLTTVPLVEGDRVNPLRYEVAGAWVEIAGPAPGGDLVAGMRMVLSARWPRIPPDGWGFVR